MYSIGIDLGGTNIAAGIVKDGRLLKKLSVPTGAGRDVKEIIKDMAQLCMRLAEGIDINELEAIGIGTPGVVDTENGIASNVVNISDKPLELRKWLSEYIDIPIYVENDANCAAIGEAAAGASKGFRNSVMVTLGTGVGGGIIIDGKIFSGIKGGGGEIGHMVICADGGVPCKCGRCGCFEQYASALALIRMMNEAAAGDAELEAQKPFDGRFIFESAKAGNETAAKVIEKFQGYLAAGIANIINIFQPEIVVVGGGMSAQGDYLLEPVRRAVGQSILTKDSSITRIVKAELENDAGIIGAAYCSKYR